MPEDGAEVETTVVTDADVAAVPAEVLDAAAEAAADAAAGVVDEAVVTYAEEAGETVADDEPDELDGEEPEGAVPDPAGRTGPVPPSDPPSE